jgi:peptidoglycan/xylan/chitin deacetylase (PgdA/CDA1 family)
MPPGASAQIAVLRFEKLGPVRELTPMRRIAARLEPGARSLILLYHRVAAPVTDPWRLAVHPDRFAEHLGVLRDGGYEPVALGELVASLRRRRVPERAVAVTFDDGYADNLETGLPLLERFGIPATVFATAGSELRHQELWWMQLEALLLEPGVLPERLEVATESFTWAWTLDGAATWTQEQAALHTRWCAADAGPPPSPRHAAFRSLLDGLRQVDAAERDAVLARLHATVGAERSRRVTHRLMDGDELCRLAGSDLVDIGGHTLSHPRLAQLPADLQRVEIAGSKARLEEVLGRSITAFAYPFGTHRDFNRASVRAVRAAGYTSAGAVRDRALSRSSDPFALPRVGVGDWTAEEFERRLERWLRRWPSSRPASTSA